MPGLLLLFACPPLSIQKYILDLEHQVPIETEVSLSSGIVKIVQLFIHFQLVELLQAGPTLRLGFGRRSLPAETKSRGVKPHLGSAPGSPSSEPHKQDEMMKTARDLKIFQGFLLLFGPRLSASTLETG